MTNTFDKKFGFLSNASTAEEDVRKMEKVSKTLKKLDQSFEETITSLTKVLETTTNKTLKGVISDLLETAKAQEDVRRRLKASGEVITKKEADSLIKVSESIRETISSNKDLTGSIRKVSSNTLVDLDVKKELENTSKEIGQDARKFFVANAKEISQSGVVGEASGVGLKAISPELGFIADAFGIDVQDQAMKAAEKLSEAASLLNTTAKKIVDDELEEEKEQAENTGELVDLVRETNFLLEEINTSISSGALSAINVTNAKLDEMIDATEMVVSREINPGADSHIQGTILVEKEFNEVNATQDDIDDELDALLGETTAGELDIIDSIKSSEDSAIESIEFQTEQMINAIEEIPDSEASQTEQLIEALEDQTIAQNEKIDDVEDAVNRSGGFFSRFLGPRSFLGRIFSPIVKVLSALAGLTGISKLLEKLNPKNIKPGMVARLGVGGLGALLGLDALKDIQEEGLTTGDALQSISSGALVGLALGGPVGALIGGGVGAFAALIANSITKEHIDKIKSGFISVGDKIFSAFDSSVEWVTKALKDPKVSVVTDLLGDLFSNPIDTLDTLFDWLGGHLNNAVFAVGQKVEGIISSTSNFFTSNFDKLTNFFSDKFNSISSTLSNIVSDPIGFIQGKYDNSETEANITPQSISMDTGSNILETSSGLENNIAQIEAARLARAASEERDKEQKVTMEREKKKSRSNAGQRGAQRNLNNSPIISNDMGMVLIIGGGL